MYIYIYDGLGLVPLLDLFGLDVISDCCDPIRFPWSQGPEIFDGIFDKTWDGGVPNFETTYISMSVFFV